MHSFRASGIFMAVTFEPSHAHGDDVEVFAPGATSQKVQHQVFISIL